MEELVQRLKKDLPSSILQMKLADFLLLSQFPLTSVHLTEPTQSQTEATPAKVRRITRSMVQVARQSIIETDVRASITATPKFHPGLPETPAIVREGRVKRVTKVPDAPRTSNVFDAPAPLRVTRATIRPSIIVAPPAETPVGSRKRRTIAKTEGPVGGVVSVEMDNGKVLDLDITASPTRMLSSMGPGMVRDLGRLFKAYAAKMTAFYKKCKVTDDDSIAKTGHAASGGKH